MAVRRERFPTRDGDFIDLDWLDGDPSSPLLLILHGLEGSSRSHYVAGLMREARAKGWSAVGLNFRSCSGESNRLPRFYHAGDTGDLDAVVRMLTDRRPTVRIGAVGVSLGGNVLLKWLGELGLDTPKQVGAAVGISVPFDLQACARARDQGFQRMVYTARFMRSFKRKIRTKLPRYPGFVDVGAAMRARTFAEYDRDVTAPLCGFVDEIDYWVRSSSGPLLERIRRPVLVINALDDPFVPSPALPDRATLPPWVTAEFTPRGGHAGFIEGRWPWASTSWAERRAVDFLASRLDADTGGE
jgi:predicted alpha/beta-fold hydrolase